MASHNETEASVVATQALRELYPLVAAEQIGLEALPDSSLEKGALAYRIHVLSPGDFPARWVLRAYHAEQRMPEHFCHFYPWASAGKAGSQDPQGAERCAMDTWMKSRAAMLTTLETCAYPAPRVLPTAGGTSVGVASGWCVLLTTFVLGSVLTPTLAQLRLLGTALGRLHTLPVSVTWPDERVIPAGTPGPSYWHPTFAIPGALARLQAAAPDMPDAWRPWHMAFTQAVEQMRQVNLPLHLIHGDVWSANAVTDSAGGATLIDWDQGGLGPAMADLGRLLLECHLDTDLPVNDALAWHISPNPPRIEAVVEGYALQRMPTPAELDALLVAMRFGIAFIGALHFDQALHGPATNPAWLASMDRRFARLQNRFQVSQEIAMLAIAHFEHLAQAGSHLSGRGS